MPVILVIFAFQAHINYMLMDKLIKAFREKWPEINFFYSSPICYLKSIRDLKWHPRSGDFFPLISMHGKF